MPFRLTRDVVDGFGAAGVAGAFERGCEVTMGVLRRDAQSLLTILEVGTYWNAMEQRHVTLYLGHGM